MGISQELTLERATPNQSSLLSNLLELYIHDLSDIFSMKIGADGRFGYDKLPHYWSEPETHFAYLIRDCGEVAGFALVTRGSPAGDSPDHLDLAEFFVLRSYRRRGVGRRAAFALWDSLPGRWIVRVSVMNVAALPFWEGVVREYTRGAYSETTHPGKTHMFRVFAFCSREATSTV